jgi:hypothetical protein
MEAKGGTHSAKVMFTACELYSVDHLLPWRKPSANGNLGNTVLVLLVVRIIRNLRDHTVTSGR